MENNIVIQLTDAEIYQREHRILSNVNVEISEGEFVYVIGKVGTGKTSLIKTLNAEIPLIKGSGQVAGFQLKNIKPDALLSGCITINNNIRVGPVILPYP